MKIDVELTGRAIQRPRTRDLEPRGRVGAWVEFAGVVREEEAGRDVAALEYEAYENMALRVMREILERLGGVLACECVQVIHRVGVVPVGEMAVWVGVGAVHRREALELVTAFMEELKRDVPIWKRRGLSREELAEAHKTTGEWGHMNRGAEAPGPATIEETLAVIRGGCRVLPAEAIPLSEAVGGVLREVVQAPEDQPAFDRSAMDGFAIRVDEPGIRLRVVDRLRAGDWRPRELRMGEAVQIATGAALPGTGLRVVMKEDSELEGDWVVVMERGRGRNVRFRGEDARKGQALVPAGTRLSPGAVALLASLGCTHPAVTRRPTVLHVVTGQEVVPPDQVPGPGQIRDSNSVLVRAFLGRFGVVPRQYRVSESRGALGEVLGEDARANGPVDLLLISGGASVGEHDFTRRVLEEQGYVLQVTRTATRPGRPLVFASRDGVPAFGLPGNPLAHFVCLNLYVRQALLALSGSIERVVLLSGRLRVGLDGGGSSRPALWPARVAGGGAEAEVTPLTWQSSGDLTSLATANALLWLGEGEEALEAGVPVRYLSTWVSE